MNASLILELTKYITTVPGVLGLASLDFNEPENRLEDIDVKKSINVRNEEDATKVSAAIIISSEIPSKTIVKEVIKIIKSTFKNNNKEASNILVYIRGVE